MAKSPGPARSSSGSILRFEDEANVPKLKSSSLLLAFSGWMDGGLVSTGTVERLVSGSGAKLFASIHSEPFYLYNFPGAMEITALFRPHVKYEAGLIKKYETPLNQFFVHEGRNIVFFSGKEPNLAWDTFADAVFELVKRVGIKRLVFIGSFGGSVPHTREPRLYASVSHRRLKAKLERYGVRFSDYEGPASFATHLLKQAPKRGVEMISLSAEIPGYLDGINVMSIEAITRQLAALLSLPVDLDSLRQASNEWEAQVTSAVEKDSDLAVTVRKLEERYDNELIGSPTPDTDIEQEFSGGDDEENED